MKRLSLLLGLVLLSCRVPSSQGSCGVGIADPATAADRDNYREACTKAIGDHVVLEHRAALQYLLMGSYFERDDVNLKGFAKQFFEHADEERQHGIKFVEFLRMRGYSDDLIFDGPFGPVLSKHSWSNGLEALTDALKMEKHVSGAIKKLVDVCTGPDSNDYLSADWLTTWLDEQMRGQRHLAGMINTLSVFRRDHASLADWMFSQHLLD